MKKYFMTGIAAVAMCAAFTSCSKDPGFEQMNPEQAIQASYEAAFIKAFGQPAPDQDWGFGTTTRGLTRSKEDNSCGTCIKPDMTNFPNYDTQYPNYTTPAPITDGERAYVKQWFEEHPGFTQGLDIQNFYVQHVWGQANKDYTLYWYRYDENRMRNNPGATSNYYNDDKTVQATMDYFCVGDGTNYTHTLDFNANNDGSGWEMVYMQNSSALSFKYHSSWSSEEFKYFRCEEIEVPGENFSDGITRKGWYVGMCCYGEKYDNGDQKLNYYDWTEQICDDWIVKIVPGDPIPPVEYQGRVMAEDLNANEKSDFDFNDVVFDWRIDGRVATIQLRAAGGTLPLFVGGQEVHDKFGVSRNTMVNTGVGSANEPDAYTYTFPEGIEPTADNIPIIVSKNNVEAELTAIRGKAASKINVPTNTRWVKEYQDISKAYSLFTDWVTDPTVVWTSSYDETYLY